jgi:hypothetical protein
MHRKTRARIRIDVAPKIKRDISDAGLNTSMVRSTKSSGEQRKEEKEIMEGL